MESCCGPWGRRAERRARGRKGWVSTSCIYKMLRNATKFCVTIVSSYRERDQLLAIFACFAGRRYNGVYNGTNWIARPLGLDRCRESKPRSISRAMMRDVSRTGWATTRDGNGAGMMRKIRGATRRRRVDIEEPDVRGHCRFFEIEDRDLPALVLLSHLCASKFAWRHLQQQQQPLF